MVPPVQEGPEGTSGSGTHQGIPQLLPAAKTGAGFRRKQTRQKEQVYSVKKKKKFHKRGKKLKVTALPGEEMTHNRQSFWL